MLPRPEPTTDLRRPAGGPTRRTGPQPARPAGPRRRLPPPLFLAVAAAAVAQTLLVHFQLYSWPLQGQLRDWTLHCTGVVAASLCTAWVLGCHLPDQGAAAGVRRTLATAVPLGITMLHELGQWIWPPGPRDAFDSVRDASLNVLGAALAYWVLRRTRPGR